MAGCASVQRDDAETKETSQMAAQKDCHFNIDKISEAWMQSATDLWACVAGQTLPGAETNPEEDNAAAHLLLQLNEMGLESFSMLSKEMSGYFDQMNSSSEKGEFLDMNERLCQTWNELYEKKFSRVFQLPKLGLMSTHMEKAARMLDKYNRLQSSIVELSRLLSQPFHRCQKKMTLKMTEMIQRGDTPKGSRDCYKEWVQELETHFMALFQTPQYVSALSSALSTLSDFISVRNEALEDLLSMFPVARKTDVDDMARELYELKKRLGRLEKKMKPEIVYTSG
jgi:polyhydroxyalkanoate synthesis regulator phasin